MALFQRDYDQAARYLERARDLLKQTRTPKTNAIRETLGVLIARLSADDRSANSAAAKINVLSDVSAQMAEGNARTEISKAIAVLRDRSDGESY